MLAFHFDDVMNWERWVIRGRAFVECVHGWCLRANQSESVIRLAFHCDDVTIMECWLFWRRGTIFVGRAKGRRRRGGCMRAACGGPIEVTSFVSNGIEIKSSRGLKIFLFLFSQDIFF